MSNRWLVTEKAEWGDHLAYYLSLFKHIRTPDHYSQMNCSIVANPDSWPPDEFFNASAGAAVLITAADLVLLIGKYCSTV